MASWAHTSSGQREQVWQLGSQPGVIVSEWVWGSYKTECHHFLWQSMNHISLPVKKSSTPATPVDGFTCLHTPPLPLSVLITNITLMTVHFLHIMYSLKSHDFWPITFLQYGHVTLHQPIMCVCGGGGRQLIQLLQQHVVGSHHHGNRFFLPHHWDTQRVKELITHSWGQRRLPSMLDFFGIMGYFLPIVNLRFSAQQWKEEEEKAAL